MARRVALFRGINVGKANRIAMAELKAIFEALGFDDVRTLLNSGNVVYAAGRAAAARDAERIGAAVAERTGITTRVLVLEAATPDAVAAANPYANDADDPSRLLVGFLLGDDRSPFEALRRAHPDERFAVGEHACYLWCPDGILDSRIGDALSGTKFRDRVTARNWATVLKLQALLAS